MPRAAIFILGMHRSGTSALAGTLLHLGVALGEELLPPAPDNPKGFFENQRILRVHDTLLKELNSAWYDMRPLPLDWEQTSAASAARSALGEFTREEFSETPLWGIKDPRLSRVLPLWIDILRDETPKAVMLLRDPREVAASLMRRDAMQSGHALALWSRYNLDAERHTREIHRAFIHYPLLLADWQSEIARISDALRLSLPVTDYHKIHAVTEFLDPALRHERLEQDSRPWPEEPLQTAMSIFEQLNELARNPRSATAVSRLDEIGTRFMLDRAHPDFARLSPLDEQISYQLETLHVVLANLARLEAEQNDLHAKLAELDAAITRLRTEGENAVASHHDRLLRAIAERDAYAACMEALHRSTSWRLTGPLRAGARMFRRRQAGS